MRRIRNNKYEYSRKEFFMKQIRVLKKSLAVFLALLITMAIVPLNVFANTTTDATPITSAAEFSEMTADGKYYLANNISLSTAYNRTFSGELDGNGKTITTSVPLFTDINGGTVKNLTVAGVINTGDNIGAAICMTTSNATFENITNKANVSSNKNAGTIVGEVSSTTVPSTITINNCTNEGDVQAGSGKHAGGILGYSNVSEKTVSIYITNCQNSGTIKGHKIGGIASYIDYCPIVVIDNCLNLPDIEATDLAGGIAGQIHKNNVEAYVSNCVNEGDIKGTVVGGIMGVFHPESKSCAIELNTKVVASNCINNGDVTSVATSGKKYAGGIVGWLVSGGVITKCGNNGTIKADGYAAGISAHSNNKVVQISYSYNTGDIISGYYAAGISACFANSASSVIGCWNSGKIIKGDTLLDGIKGVRCAQIAIGNIGIYHDNFFLDSVVAPEMAAGATVGAMLLPYYLTNDNKTTDVDSLEEKSSSFKTEDLASGKLACDINTSLGKSVFFHRLNGDNKDTIPTSDSSRGIVFNNNGTYLSILIETQSEASARIEAENAGLRFTTDVNKDDYNALLSAGISEVSFGTVITLNNTIKGIEEFGDVFTVDKLQNGSYHNFSATLNTEGDTYYFRNSIVNIPADKYEEEIVAIGYIKIGDTVLYSGNYSVRSVKDVATDAYEDRAMTSGILGYSNAIAADSSVSIASKLSYSPYTEAQLAIIKVFVG